jgi:hypothetical protein
MIQIRQISSIGHVASSIGRLLYVASSEQPLVHIPLPLPQECSIAVAAGTKAK